jgi:DNA-binding Lrp family transcriptional regulator
MDRKDRQIIRALQENGRMTNQELADKVGLSPSPCLRRLRALEKSGVIRGYSVEVDREAYGLPVTVFVRVKLDKHTEDTVSNFEAKVRKIENIVECHVMTGQSDYLLKVVIADLASYEIFVRKNLHPIGGIASIDTSFAYGEVKKTAVLPKVG